MLDIPTFSKVVPQTDSCSDGRGRKQTFTCTSTQLVNRCTILDTWLIFYSIRNIITFFITINLTHI